MKRRKSRRPRPNKEEIELLKAVCEAIEQMDVETRIEAGRFRGGACMVEGSRKLLIINKNHPIERQIATALSEFRKLVPGDEPLPLPDGLRDRLAAYQ